jgi:hypothetical protein
MFQRGVTTDDIRHVVTTGVTIETRPHDRPLPSRIVLGWINARPPHVVVADDPADDTMVIVTAYVPDPLLWRPGFRKRRRR